jgi:hypothetical protein
MMGTGMRPAALVLLATLFVGAAGCGGQPDVSTPQATIKSLIAAGTGHRIEVLKKLLTPELAAKLTRTAPKNQAYLPLIAVALGQSRVGPARVTGGTAAVLITIDRDIALNQLSRYLDEYGDRYALSDVKKRRAFSLSLGSRFSPQYRLTLVKRGRRWLIDDLKGIGG